MCCHMYILITVTRFLSPLLLSDSSQLLAYILSLLLHKIRVSVIISSFPLYLSELILHSLTVSYHSLQLIILCL